MMGGETAGWLLMMGGETAGWLLMMGGETAGRLLMMGGEMTAGGLLMSPITGGEVRPTNSTLVLPWCKPSFPSSVTPSDINIVGICRVCGSLLATGSVEPWAGLRRGCGSSLQPPPRSVVTTLSWVLAAVMTGVRGISHRGGGGTRSIMSFATLESRIPLPGCEGPLPVCLDATGFLLVNCFWGGVRFRVRLGVKHSCCTCRALLTPNTSPFVVVDSSCSFRGLTLSCCSVLFPCVSLFEKVCEVVLSLQLTAGIDSNGGDNRAGEGGGVRLRTLLGVKHSS